MEKLTILSADLLDIIFEHRNKSYGAYDLRKTYNKRITYALAGMFFICLLFIGGTILANNKKPDRLVEMGPDVILNRIEDKPVEPVIPPPKPEVEPPKLELVKVTPPLIVPDELVDPKDEVKPIDNLENARISKFDQDGKENDGTTIAPPVENVTTVAAPLRADDFEDKEFFTVQYEASFAGGIEGWAKYLRKNLNSDIPNDHGAPPNKYTVVVSFIVDKTGVISDVRAENDPGYGTKAEAIRVIQKSPNWKPAMQNGRNVIYRQKQAITFQVVEQ